MRSNTTMTSGKPRVANKPWFGFFFGVRSRLVSRRGRLGRGGRVARGSVLGGGLIGLSIAHELAPKNQALLAERERALRDNDAYLRQRFPDHDQLDARTQGLIARFIEQRRELLERGTHRQEELNLKLTDTNTRTHELVELTSNFQQFLMGNLLWVRDYSFVSPTLLWSQLSSLLAPANWLPLPQALGQGLVHGQWEMLGLVLMLALLLGRRWLQPQLQALLQRPPSLADEKVSHSGKALLLGLLLRPPVGR